MKKYILLLVIFASQCIWEVFFCSQLFGSHLLSEESFIWKHCEDHSNNFMCCCEDCLLGGSPSCFLLRKYSLKTFLLLTARSVIRKIIRLRWRLPRFEMVLRPSYWPAWWIRRIHAGKWCNDMLVWTKVIYVSKLCKKSRASNIIDTIKRFDDIQFFDPQWFTGLYQ